MWGWSPQLCLQLVRSPDVAAIANAFVAVGVYSLNGIPNSEIKPDPERALELLRTMPPGPPDEDDSRAPAVNALMERALADKKPERAMELLQEFSARGMYPYGAARGVITSATRWRLKRSRGPARRSPSRCR